MKKLVYVLTLFILLLGILTACSRDGEKVSLYFANAEKTMLVTENFLLRETELTPKEQAAVVLEALLRGPSVPENARLIPQETTVLDLNLKDHVLTVNLSSAFETAASTDAILARSSVVKTLTEISSIDKVQLLVDGASIISASTGEPVPAMGAGDIIMNFDEDIMDKVVLTLYFYNPATERLQEEKRVITVKENTAMAKNIVSELLKGPENKTLISLLSPETTILSADTKENVCFVNFDRMFCDKNITSDRMEQMAIYSIVNALTELSSVEIVQFLIEGDKVEKLKNLSINEPFVRNEVLLEEFVEKEATSEGEEHDEL